MADQVPPRVLVAALVTLLSDALDHEETLHLAHERFRADLRGLRARVENELASLAGSRRLRLPNRPMTQWATTEPGVEARYCASVSSTMPLQEGSPHSQRNSNRLFSFASNRLASRAISSFTYPAHERRRTGTGGLVRG